MHITRMLQCLNIQCKEVVSSLLECLTERMLCVTEEHFPSIVKSKPVRAGHGGACL